MRNGNQGVIEMTYIEKFWRDATAADVARALAGEVVEARFRDSEIHVWTSVRRLIGARAVDVPEIALRWLDCASGWRYCQAYAPPQWYSDKPEPGEGYRLLGKFPDEALQPGDEVFDLRGDRKWELSFNAEAKHPQDYSSWYRRRIDPPKPDPKFAVGQRVKIVGPPAKGVRAIYNWTDEMEEYIGVVGAVRLKPTQDPEGTFYAVGGIVEWSFREDYLEAVIEPEPKHYTLQVGDTCDVPSGHRLAVTEHGVEVT